jgi:HK97 family phage major capsid protein
MSEKKLTLDELKQIISDEVQKALEPLKEKASNYPTIIVNKEKIEREIPKGLVAARLVRALVAGNGDPERARKFVEKNIVDDGINDIVAKALTSDTGPTGGYLVPQQYAEEVIELLSAKAVVRKMGAVSLPLEGTLNIPKLTAGATAYFIGEAQNIPVSQPTFDQIKLTEKTLVTMVPISNKLIRLSSPKVDVQVRNNMIDVMAKKEDLAFIRGTGTDYSPKGLLYWAVSTNKFSANSTVTVSNIAADLQAAINKLESANVPMDKVGWIMSPRVKNFLMTAMNQNGIYVWRDEMEKGTLLGYPYAVTTQIPSNLGTAGNESEVYLVDFSECIIGDGPQLEVSVSTEAAYEQNGTFISAFQSDLTVVKMVRYVDFAVRHEEAVAVIQNVTWGA